MIRDKVIEDFVTDLKLHAESGRDMLLARGYVIQLALALEDYSFDANKAISYEEVDRIISDEVNSALMSIDITQNCLDRIFRDSEKRYRR